MSVGEVPGDLDEMAMLRESLAAARERIDELQQQLRVRESALEMATERERRRIAQQIHDGVAQSLALLLIKIEIVSRLADGDLPRAKVELARARSVLEATVDELRRSLGEWRSSLDAGG